MQDQVSRSPVIQLSENGAATGGRATSVVIIVLFGQILNGHSIILPVSYLVMFCLSLSHCSQLFSQLNLYASPWFLMVARFFLSSIFLKQCTDYWGFRVKPSASASHSYAGVLCPWIYVATVPRSFWSFHRSPAQPSALIFLRERKGLHEVLY